MVKNLLNGRGRLLRDGNGNGVDAQPLQFQQLILIGFVRGDDFNEQDRLAKLIEESYVGLDDVTFLPRWLDSFPIRFAHPSNLSGFIFIKLIFYADGIGMDYLCFPQSGQAVRAFGRVFVNGWHFDLLDALEGIFGDFVPIGFIRERAFSLNFDIGNMVSEIPASVQLTLAGNHFLLTINTIVALLSTLYFRNMKLFALNVFGVLRFLSLFLYHQ